MQKFHIKRNDAVIVIAGSHKGKQGKVLEIRAAKNRAVVEGVAMIKNILRNPKKTHRGKLLNVRVQFTFQILCCSHAMSSRSALNCQPQP